MALTMGLPSQRDSTRTSDASAGSKRTRKGDTSRVASEHPGSDSNSSDGLLSRFVEDPFRQMIVQLSASHSYFILSAGIHTQTLCFPDVFAPV